MPTEVLLVDDETNILTTLGETLRAAGFEIFQEESGEDALSRLAIHKPDLIGRGPPNAEDERTGIDQSSQEHCS